MTRDDLVGQYVGHTAPKTKEVLKRAMGGVLFIDEAYYLYRPENERDYGQEAIEILLQVMEDDRDDLVVILAGYDDRMDDVLLRPTRAWPRGSRTTSTSPTSRRGELVQIAELMLARRALPVLTRGARQAFARVPRAADARSRASPTRAASATPSSGAGCGRRAGWSPRAGRCPRTTS